MNQVAVVRRLRSSGYLDLAVHAEALLNTLTTSFTLARDYVAWLKSSQPRTFLDRVARRVAPCARHPGRDLEQSPFPRHGMPACRFPASISAARDPASNRAAVASTFSTAADTLASASSAAASTSALSRSAAARLRSARSWSRRGKTAGNASSAASAFCRASSTVISTHCSANDAVGRSPAVVTEPEFLSVEECLAHAETCQRKAQFVSLDHELRHGWFEVAVQWLLLAREAEARGKA
jgi:hypothetical protein